MQENKNKQNRCRTSSDGLKIPDLLEHLCRAVDLDQLPRHDASLSIYAVKHRLLKTFALWTIAVLLFAQGALVVNACLRIDTGSQTAFGQPQMVDCEMGLTNPNACLYQYLDQSDQTGAQPSSTLPTVNLVPLMVSGQISRIVKNRAGLPPRGCDPPIPIRYCSLLI